jgi:sterol 3beta-glucosyltransferase
MGLAKTWASMDEGFHHAPKLWGSQIRTRKQPTDFVEGIGEATKGVIYGFADPVMDLVKEPMRGAKEEGALGVVKGFARAGINFGFKPAAGIMGTVTLPVQGLITSCVCLCEIGEPDAAPG